MWFCTSPPRFHPHSMPLARSAVTGVSAWRKGILPYIMARIFGSDGLTHSGQYMDIHTVKEMACPVGLVFSGWPEWLFAFNK